MVPVAFVPGSAASVAATASSVGAAITMGEANGLLVTNTSATLYISARYGVGAQTAVLGQDITIPPMGMVLVEANKAVTHVAAIGSGAGPTAVVFTPVKLPHG